VRADIHNGLFCVVRLLSEKLRLEGIQGIDHHGYVDGYLGFILLMLSSLGMIWTSTKAKMHIYIPVCAKL